MIFHNHFKIKGKKASKPFFSRKVFADSSGRELKVAVFKKNVFFIDLHFEEADYHFFQITNKSKFLFTIIFSLSTLCLGMKKQNNKTTIKATQKIEAFVIFSYNCVVNLTHCPNGTSLFYRISSTWSLYT